MKHQFFLLTLLAVLAMPLSAAVLYRISGNGLSESSYLFGTHHLAPLSILDSVPEVRKSLDDVDAVVGEMDMLSLNQAELALKMQPYMMCPSDSTLRQVLTAAEYNKVDSALQQMTGMHLELFDAMRPMVVQTVAVTSIISSRMPGFIPGQQLDIYMQQVAKEGGKVIVGLETVEQQAETLYCSQSINAQAKALVEMFDDIDSEAKKAQEMNDTYMSRDLDGLYEFSRKEEGDPAFMEALLVERNKKWMTKLPSIIGTAPAMIVVGALHLPGPGGLVCLLRGAGFTVEPVDVR